MLKIISMSFNRCNNCIITIAPLIVFCTLILLYCHFTTLTTNSAAKHLFSIFTLLIMSGGFLASWLYSVKKAIESCKNSKYEKSLKIVISELSQNLFKGIGRLFFSCVWFLMLCAILLSLIFSVAAFLQTSFPFLNLYSTQVLILLIFFGGYISILWLPELVYNEKNVLYALYNSIIKVVSEFWDTMSLYIFISVLLTAIITIMIKFVLASPLVSFLILMAFYYINLYIVVLLFTYYEQKFIEPSK